MPARGEDGVDETDGGGHLGRQQPDVLNGVDGNRASLLCRADNLCEIGHKSINEPAGLTFFMTPRNVESPFMTPGSRACRSKSGWMGSCVRKRTRRSASMTTVCSMATGSLKGFGFTVDAFLNARPTFSVCMNLPRR